jgi:DNA repair photolyase
MMPLLPFVTDNVDNVLGIIHATKHSGAKFIYPLLGLSLRTGQREYLYRKFDEFFPQLHLKQSYTRLYGSSYECHSPREHELWEIFTKECNHSGILYRMEDIITAYKKGYEYDQLTLFS